jgi:hypothetical protein
MVAAKIIGTEIKYANGELTISLGRKDTAVPSKPASELTLEQVQGMINTSLARNNESMSSVLANQQVKINESVRQRLDLNSKRMNELVKTAAMASEDEVRSFVGGLRDENLRLMKDYLQLSSQEQNKYVEHLLVGFSKYLEEQRVQDLNAFQTRMSSVESNTNQFKEQTEQILSSIISNSAVKQRNY